MKKTDDTVPSLGAISMAARDFKKQRGQRGRKKGCKATSKAEDKKILQVFSKLRPPGSAVTHEEKRGGHKSREQERGKEGETKAEREEHREREGEKESERERGRQMRKAVGAQTQQEREKQEGRERVRKRHRGRAR